MSFVENEVIVKDLGLIDFDEAYQIQVALFEQHNSWKIQTRNGVIIPPPPHFILFCEHYPVITIGVSGKEKNILYPLEFLKEKGIKVIRTNRGGDVTFHSPGQVIMYPIIDLEKINPDVKWFLQLLENITIKTLNYYGINAVRIEGKTGVWIKDTYPPQKICSIGIRCTRWITMHGLALNVNNSTEGFSYINPCGFTDIEITSVKKQIGREIPIQEIKKLLLENFLNETNFKLRK